MTTSPSEITSTQTTHTADCQGLREEIKQLQADLKHAAGDEKASDIRMIAEDQAELRREHCPGT